MILRTGGAGVSVGARCLLEWAITGSRCAGVHIAATFALFLDFSVGFRWLEELINDRSFLVRSCDHKEHLVLEVCSDLLALSDRHVEDLRRDG